jgi:hypothetical protein
MEAIRQILTIPKDHKVILEIPEVFKEDELLEIIIRSKGKLLNKKEKLEIMKEAVLDPMFMEDLKEVNEDFQSIESEEIY